MKQKTEEEFIKDFKESVPSVLAVAKYLESQGLTVALGDTEYQDPGTYVDKGDIWVLKEDGTKDYRVEVRQLKKEDFTCADDFRHPVMTHYFCHDWAKLKPKPAWVFIVNKDCTCAAKIKCGNEVANWIVTNAPRYASYAVTKDSPEYIAL